jgi:hypothetical protein
MTDQLKEITMREVRQFFADAGSRFIEHGEPRDAALDMARQLMACHGEQIPEGYEATEASAREFADEERAAAMVSQ